jgi:hypothetical protein
LLQHLLPGSESDGHFGGLVVLTGNTDISTDR